MEYTAKDVINKDYAAKNMPPVHVSVNYMKLQSINILN